MSIGDSMWQLKTSPARAGRTKKYTHETKSQPITTLVIGASVALAIFRFINKKSRMKGDFHVRFRENVRVN
jgi:hypothetical protein